MTRAASASRRRTTSAPPASVVPASSFECAPATSRGDHSFVGCANYNRPAQSALYVVLAARCPRPRKEPLVARHVLNAADTSVRLIAERHDRGRAGGNRLVIQGVG